MIDNNIKAVIFDYNGVVTQEGHFEPFMSEYARNLGKDEAYLLKIVREEWDGARMGQNDGKNVWNKAAVYLGVPFEQLRKEWVDHFPIRPEMIDLVCALRPHYKTALMTNMIQCWFEDVSMKYPLQDYFDSIFTSYQVRAAKPDSRIFEYALNELGFDAEECLFIDDQIKNTSVAKRLGFKTILFESEEQLRRELRGYGVCLD